MIQFSSISRKHLPVRILFPAFLTVFLFVVSEFLVYLPAYRSSIMDQKRQGVQSLVETAIGVLEHFHSLEKTNVLSKEEAQKSAAKVLKSLRYGKEEKDYFWINDTTPRMIMHPYRQEMDGEDLSKYQDLNGNRLFVDSVRVTQGEKGGFIDYSWQWKDDSSRVVPKVSYVKRFEPWQWIVGSGIYVEDVQKEVDRITKTILAISTIILILIASLSLLLIFLGIDAEQKKDQAEVARLKMEEKFRRIVENASDIIFTLNEDGRFEFISKTWSEILGHSLEQVIGKPYKDFIHEEDLPLCAKSFEKVVIGGEKQHSKEFRFISVDKAVRWFVCSASPLAKDGGERHFLGIARDVTSTRETEVALRESERKYRLLADNATDIIWTTDLHGGYTFISPAIESALGFRFQTGLTCTDLLTPESNALFMKTVEEKLAEDSRTPIEQRRNEPMVLELEAIKSDGSHCWFEVTSRLLRNELNGEPIGLIGVSRDIFERRQIMAEREKLQVQVARSQKMDALGTLAGGIAHDFNNILAIILGNIEMARTDLPSDSEVHEELEQVYLASMRAKDLVGQILAFSRWSELKKQPVSMQLILREALKMLRASLPSTISMERRIPKETIQVLADPTQIHQVLINLCTNAAHAMKEKGGTLTVALKEVALEQEHVKDCGNIVPGPYALVEISDTGVGISSDIQDRIFDPYFTTKQKGEGTGLGLSVVHGILKSYGGFIKLQSEVGKGTTFSIYFPETSKSEVSINVQDESIEKGSERIIFVDDEVGLVNMADRMLRRLGYDVYSFSDSVVALDYFMMNPENIDLVITDQTMPNLKGDELIRRIRKKNPKIPVIMCSGYTENLGSDELKELHINGILKKPITIHELSNAIRTVLNGLKLMDT